MFATAVMAGELPGKSEPRITAATPTTNSRFTTVCLAQPFILMVSGWANEPPAVEGSLAVQSQVGAEDRVQLLGVFAMSVR